jgi:cation-transporting ATPase V
MTCGSCAARIEKTLAKQSGVTEAEVNFATGTARVQVTPGVDEAALARAVDDLGYQLRRAGVRTVDFDVEGLTCGSCATRVQKALAGQPGVEQAEVNLATAKARVELDPGVASTEALQAAVDRTGYGLSPAAELSPDVADAADPEVAAQRAWLRRLVVGGPLAAVVAVIAMYRAFTGAAAAWMHWTEFAVTTPVQFWIGWPFLREAAKRARHLTANMDTLIAIGTLAAYTYSTVALVAGGDLYFEVAAIIIGFLVLGRFFEARAKSRAGRAIRALLELGAKEARVVRDGQEVMVPVEQVAVGDLVRVRPGEKVPTDGMVVEGASAIDESMLTGESVPVDKTEGSKIAGATINISGALTVEATAVGADTALAQIVRWSRRPRPARGPSSAWPTGSRRVRPHRHRHRAGQLRRLVAGGRGPHRWAAGSRRGADHRLPLCARAGHADRHHGRHRPRRGARRAHQGRRGARTHPQGHDGRVRQDRHAHPRADDPDRPPRR